MKKWMSRAISDDFHRREVKVVTAWVQSYLGKENIVVKNLVEDFRDGVFLCKLYESITEEKLPRYRLHPKVFFLKINNLSIVLKRLNEKAKEAGIGIQFSAHKIANGDDNEIFSVLWAMKYKFFLDEKEGEIIGENEEVETESRIIRKEEVEEEGEDDEEIVKVVAEGDFPEYTSPHEGDSFKNEIDYEEEVEEDQPSTSSSYYDENIERTAYEKMIELKEKHRRLEILISNLKHRHEIIEKEHIITTTSQQHEDNNVLFFKGKVGDYVDVYSVRKKRIGSGEIVSVVSSSTKSITCEVKIMMSRKLVTDQTYNFESKYLEIWDDDE